MTAFIGPDCPFTGQKNLELPNQPKGRDAWYGKVPEIAGSMNVNIWYFQEDVLEHKGWIIILETFIKPKGKNYTERVLWLGKAAQELYNTGNIKQAGIWIFLLIDKNPVFNF